MSRFLLAAFAPFALAWWKPTGMRRQNLCTSEKLLMKLCDELESLLVLYLS